MMYYVNWVLTAAQLDLIASDVCVVDYNYGRKKDKKRRNKGEFNDAKANQSDVRKAANEWMEKYGQPTDGSTGSPQAGGISLGSVFGGSVKGAKGIRTDGT